MTLNSLIARVEAGEGEGELLSLSWQITSDLIKPNEADGPAIAMLVRDALAGSLDAVTALAERLLPGRIWTIDIYADSQCSASCRYGCHEIFAHAKTEPRARLAALLRALSQSTPSSSSPAQES